MTLLMLFTVPTLYEPFGIGQTQHHRGAYKLTEALRRLKVDLETASGEKVIYLLLGETDAKPADKPPRQDLLLLAGWPSIKSHEDHNDSSVNHREILLELRQVNVELRWMWHIDEELGVIQDALVGENAQVDGWDRHFCWVASYWDDSLLEKDHAEKVIEDLRFWAPTARIASGWKIEEGGWARGERKLTDDVPGPWQRKTDLILFVRTPESGGDFELLFHDRLVKRVGCTNPNIVRIAYLLDTENVRLDWCISASRKPPLITGNPNAGVVRWRPRD